MMNEMVIEVLPGEGTLVRTLADLPMDENVHVTVRLSAGVYRGKAELRRGNVTIEGVGPETVITWNDGAFEVLPDGMKRGTFRTATLFVDGANITLRRLTVENTAAPREAVGQALALYADGDLFLCEDCVLRSYQDTLFTAPLPPKEVEKNGFIGPKQYAPRVFQRHVYRHCVIRGDVDFIFGGAAAWFEDCDIVTKDGRTTQDTYQETYATAASTSEGQKYGYVFNSCRFMGVNVPDGSVYLGRPWRSFAQTIVMHSELGAHIHPAGWEIWGKQDFRDQGLYAEYQNEGPGTAGRRADFSRPLTEEEAAAIIDEAEIEVIPARRLDDKAR